MLNSLQGRILFLASLTLAVFSGLTGFVLQQAFQYSLEEGAKERLQTHIYALLAAADIEDNRLLLPMVLQEERFNQLNSGLYGYVVNQNGGLIWRSQSTLNVQLQPSQLLAPGIRRFEPVFHPKGAATETPVMNSKKEPAYPVMAFSMGVVWEMSGGREESFTFTLLESKRPYLAKLDGFKKIIRQGLWGGSVILLILQYLILRWGLAPIKNIAQRIRGIEEGRWDSIKGEYPKELEVVARNINLLVGNERRQRERYRHTMSDLAHSLKTPLAVMQNAITQEERLVDLKTVAEEQLGRMRQIVSHQLHRAVAVAPSSVMKGCSVRKVMNALLSALKKVYYEKNLEAVVEIDDQLSFYGDEADLLEILGNILDNAFKHAKRKVVCCAKQQMRGAQYCLIISIADDGSGIAESKRVSVLQRGVRADSRHKGQGIGLAVAAEICASYHGHIEVSHSSLGGANLTLLFPVRMSLENGVSNDREKK